MPFLFSILSRSAVAVAVAVDVAVAVAVAAGAAVAVGGGRRVAEPVPAEGGAARRAEGGAKRRPLGRVLIYLFRFLHIQPDMRAFVVIKPHSLMHSFVRLLFTFKRHIQRVLLFENTIEPFSKSVLSTMIFLGHTNPKSVASQAIHVRMAAVLATTVRVMDRLTALRKASERLVKRIQATFRFKAVRTAVSHDFTRINIHNRTEKHVSVICSDIRDVTDPDLVDMRYLQVLDQIAENGHRMPRIGGSAGLFRRRNQKVIVAQHSKKHIPANVHTLFFQFRLQYFKKLAAADPRMYKAFPINQFHNQSRINLSFLTFLSAFIPVVATHIRSVAKRGNIDTFLFRLLQARAYSIESNFFL